MKQKIEGGKKNWKPGYSCPKCYPTTKENKDQTKNNKHCFTCGGYKPDNGETFGSSKVCSCYKEIEPLEVHVHLVKASIQDYVNTNDRVVEEIGDKVNELVREINILKSR